MGNRKFETQCQNFLSVFPTLTDSHVGELLLKTDEGVNRVPRRSEGEEEELL